MNYELVRAREAADLAEISYSTFRTHMSNGTAPKPILLGGKGVSHVWLKTDVVEWAQSRNRSAGRPKKETT